MLASRIILLLLLVCWCTATVEVSNGSVCTACANNSNVSLITARLFDPLTRTRRHSVSESWKDRLVDNLRSLIGTRANDPWRYFMPIKEFRLLDHRSSSPGDSRDASSGPVAIPAEFDARVRWPHCPTIGEIFEQGKCASCWAVAPTDVMSDRICIHSKGRHVVRLSAGNLLSCCKMCGRGCQGGFPGGAWMHWKRNGIVTGAAYNSNYGCQRYQFLPCYQARAQGSPYSQCPKQDQTALKCHHTCQASYGRRYEDDLYYGEHVYRIPNNVQAIQLEILENGPVQANLRIYEDFLKYKSGVYRHVRGKGLEYHAVRLLGWGVEKGTPYWLAANPWSKQWGNGGFFKILRGSDHVEIESHVMAGIPRLPRNHVINNDLENSI